VGLEHAALYLFFGELASARRNFSPDHVAFVPHLFSHTFFAFKYNRFFYSHRLAESEGKPCQISDSLHIFDQAGPFVEDLYDSFQSFEDGLVGTIFEDVLHDAREHIEIAFLEIISQIECISAAGDQFVDDLHDVFSVILILFVCYVDVVVLQEIELVVLAVVYFGYFGFHML
jgi:hypothetical protein